MGDAFEAADGGLAMAGNDVDNRADNDGIDGRMVGLAVAVVPGTVAEAGPGGAIVGGAEDSSGTEAIDAEGGIEMNAAGRLLPACEGKNGDISHTNPIKHGGEPPAVWPTPLLKE